MNQKKKVYNHKSYIYTSVLPSPTHGHPGLPNGGVAEEIIELLASGDVSFHNHNTKQVWGGWVYVEETNTKVTLLLKYFMLWSNYNEKKR